MSYFIPLQRVAQGASNQVPFTCMTLIKGAPSKQDTNRYARVVQHVKGSVQREKAHGERQLIVWPSAASVECVHCKAPFALSLSLSVGNIEPPPLHPSTASILQAVYAFRKYLHIRLHHSSVTDLQVNATITNE